MSRHPDRKPKSVQDDTERFELAFKRVLEDVDGEIWTAAERRRNLERLNPLIADYRAKLIELGVAGSGGKAKKNGSNGKATLRRSA